MIDLFEAPGLAATLIFLLIVPALLLKLRTLAKRGTSTLPLPPGPSGYPIIGNLFDIGKSHQPWVTYSKIADKYGDIVFVESLGTKILVLSSMRRATDLLEKRSSIYSGRPRMPMLQEHMGYEMYFVQMQNGPMWRRQRKAFHQHFNASVLARYHPMIGLESVRLIQAMASDPSRFSRHIQHYFNTLIVKSTYGVEILEENDPYIAQGMEVMEGFNTAGVPGAFLVDVIPWLEHVPRWMPGTGWRTFADHYKAASARARIEPWKQIMRSYKEGSAEPCIATRMIESLPPPDDPTRGEEETIARDALAVTYIAASDTSLAAGRTFILLMAMYPDIQRKAQQEIDDVVGFGQLPTFEDRPKLVYVNALLRELFRWHRELPLSLPHATTEDDIYEGYFIPKGTIVVVNVWRILGDPDNYPNPSEFNPERHIKDGKIDEDVLNPYDAAFGFGRRICPGRHMALETLYSMVVSFLAFFDISPPKDEQGKPALKYSFNEGGVIVSPDPFECVITPRSGRHAQTIKAFNR